MFHDSCLFGHGTINRSLILSIEKRLAIIIESVVSIALNRIQPLPLKNVQIGGSFWERYFKLVREKVLPYQWDVLNDRIEGAARSHCIKNFEIAAGRRKGEYYGMVFQDSDVYKWLEAVAYSLETKPDLTLEKLADSAIELIGAAQCTDGYINTYYTIKEPNARWSNLQQGHELYCAGHMIEAAVAYKSATGKCEFLDIACRFADCIDSTFGPEDDKLHGYPGHQEIELALIKLYRVTGERRYLKLAEYFIRQRGKTPNYFDDEQLKPNYVEIFHEIASFDRTYSQSHREPVEQRVAVGHAVRAVYMYSAMADLAAELDDEALRIACDALYDDITKRQMYITGAIGSTSRGESFTTAYDLPNDLIYGETCASVGLMRFCRRMNAMHHSAFYADTMERALYNTVLAGISIAGTEFFYVNPLEVEPRKISKSANFEHVKAVRQRWFDCSCCPTNIARTIMGLGTYVYGTTKDALYVNLYCEGSAKDGERSITISTEYPYGETAEITVNGGRFKLFMHNPENAPILSVELNGEKQDLKTENGYIILEQEWNNSMIKLTFDMSPKLVYCSTKLQNNIGKVAIMRGPLVYCMEQVDNSDKLGAYLLPAKTQFTQLPSPDGLPIETVALETPAYKYKNAEERLYTSLPPTMENTIARFIPYFLWANRNENEMRVFLPIECPLS